MKNVLHFLTRVKYPIPCRALLLQRHLNHNYNKLDRAGGSIKPNLVQLGMNERI